MKSGTDSLLEDWNDRKAIFEENYQRVNTVYTASKRTTLPGEQMKRSFRLQIDVKPATKKKLFQRQQNVMNRNRFNSLLTI